MRVFFPKRRKAVLVGDIAVRKQAIIFDMVSELGLQVIALEVMPDHVHIFINAPTHESPADIARWVKQIRNYEFAPSKLQSLGACTRH